MGFRNQPQPKIVKISDPSLGRPNKATIIMGGSGTGRTLLALRLATKPLVLDGNRTIGRHAHLPELTDVRVVVDATIESIHPTCDLIERSYTRANLTEAERDRLPQTLIVDGFNRFANQLESELSALPKNAYYTAFRERWNAVVQRLLRLPCDVIVVCGTRQLKAKAGDVIGGYLVGAGESIAIDDVPDLPVGTDELFDVVIQTLRDQHGYSATVHKSLFPAIPSPATYSKPLEQLSERYALVQDGKYPDRSTVLIDAERLAALTQRDLQPSRAQHILTVRRLHRSAGAPKETIDAWMRSEGLIREAQSIDSASERALLEAHDRLVVLNDERGTQRQLGNATHVTAA